MNWYIQNVSYKLNIGNVLNKSYMYTKHIYKKNYNDELNILKNALIYVYYIYHSENKLQ